MTCLPYIEKYIWNNLKMYLMTQKSCLFDNILKIKDGTKDRPSERYADFNKAVTEHIGLTSFIVGQSTQFNKTPYVSVEIVPIATAGCGARAVIDFNIVFSVDTPENCNEQRVMVGNNSESVASFRANVLAALDELMFGAGNPESKHYQGVSFFDVMRDKDIKHPFKDETTAWKYNIEAHISKEKTIINPVEQLKKEDRHSGLLVFGVEYVLDINRLYGENNCGC